MRRAIAFAATLVLLLLSLTVPTVSAAGLPVTPIASGLSSPVYVTNAGDARLFVVEQTGRIKIIHPGGAVSTFIDLSGIIKTGSEQGLLGLAFSPNYSSNGLFYVTYTRKGDAADTIAEFHVSANPDVASPSTARVLLAIPDPYSNHNGGWIAFKGQYLYVSEGDGGSGGDPQNRAQNTSSLLGKILRIIPADPDGSGPQHYTIPSDNPYVGRTGADEIWSLGLRNPWRCSFDSATGQLWCGDVGQDKYEEVDRVQTGKATNFGWRKLEGKHYYKWSGHPSGSVCTSNCFTKPIAEYAHGGFGGGNCAVTGGYVSRRAGAVLNAKYVFGDYCSGKVWVIPANYAPGTPLPSPVADTGYNISSFGQGADGRLYLVDLNGGIYRLDES